MAITTHFKTLILNTVALGQPWTPIDYYLGLWAGGEVSDGNYARQPISLTLDGNNDVTNTSAKQFPAAASTYTYNRYVLFDAATGGNVLLYSSVDNTDIAAGQAINIAAGALTFSLT